MESYERGDSLASAEDAPGRSSPAVPPSAPTHGTAAALEGSGSHKPLSPQRSNTFSAPKSTLHQQVVSYTDTVGNFFENFFGGSYLLHVAKSSH